VSGLLSELPLHSRPENDDFSTKMAEATEGYGPADLKNVVDCARQQCRIDGTGIDEKTVMDAVGKYVPASITNAGVVKSTKTWHDIGGTL
jgi:hypothetical protein